MAGSDAASRNNAVRASDGRLGTGQEGREQVGLGKGASLRGEKKKNHCWKMGDGAPRSQVRSVNPWAITVFNIVCFLHLSPRVIKHHIL